jgi:WD40 repeat protein
VGHARNYSGTLGIVLWDVASRKQVGKKQAGKTEAVASYLLKYSSDGKRLLAVVGPTLSMLDAATCELLWPSISEPGMINSAQWSQDGQQILLATTDGTVRPREAASGKPVGAPMLRQVGANVAVFSPDPEGAVILVGYADGNACLWDRASQ